MSDEEFKGRVISNPDKEISNTRELQGQSPYLVNLGLVYNLFNKDLYSSFKLLNFFLWNALYNDFLISI